MDPEFQKARIYMQEKIYEFLMQRQPQPQEEQTKKKIREIAKRLEDGLLKTAVSKDEYMNLDTLENRLHTLVKRPHLSNNNLQFPPFVNSSSPVGTMTPTPGMSHSGNPNLMVTSSVDSSMIATSGCNSIAPTSVNTGSLLPSGNGPSVGIHSGSFNSSDGFLSIEYQQSPSNFSTGSGGNNMMSSMGVPRITSQMIPTPGFNNNNNQSYMNLESSNNGGGFSSVESTMVSQPQQQKQHAGGQNSHILHNLGDVDHDA